MEKVWGMVISEAVSQDLVIIYIYIFSEASIKNFKRITNKLEYILQL